MWSPFYAIALTFEAGSQPIEPHHGIIAASHMRRLKNLATEYSTRIWSTGGLSSRQLASELWARSIRNDLSGRAAQLSFYFLVAAFPLLIFLSTVIGYFLNSQADTYFTLLNYLNRIMPRAAFALFHDALNQIANGASNGKLSFGLLVSLWTSSSGIAALIEGLNIAFAVPNLRSWWRRRLLAIVLTLGIGVLIATALVFLFVSRAAGAFVAANVPVLSTLSTLSGALQWFVGLFLLTASLILLYRFGPNVEEKPWEGVLPGCCVALLGWILASLGFRLYLSYFGSLNRTYGSLAGVIALLFWLYLSAAAILLGGELNSIIWQAVADKALRPRRND